MTTLTDLEMAAKLGRFVKNVPCRCERQWHKGESVVVTTCYRCRLIAEYETHMAARGMPA